MNAPKNITSEPRKIHIRSLRWLSPVEVSSTGGWCCVGANCSADWACVTFVVTLFLAETEYGTRNQVVSGSGSFTGRLRSIVRRYQVDNRENHDPHDVDEVPVETRNFEVERIVGEFATRRSFMIESLNNIDGVRVLMPEGAFYAFPNVSAYYGLSHEGRVINGSGDMADYLLDTKELAVVPGAAFGSDEHLRLSYACSVDMIEAGLKRLQEALAVLC